MNETLKTLMEQVLPGATPPDSLQLLAEHHSKALRDLRINASNAMQYLSLSDKEKTLISLAVAVNENRTKSMSVFSSRILAAGGTEEEIAEVYACVSLLNTNNVFYRFRHFTGKEYYEQTPAGIKMTIMSQPVLGKEFFELLSLCISALNGCERCVVSHEASLVSLGTSQARIYDAIRLTAIMKGLMVLSE